LTHEWKRERGMTDTEPEQPILMLRGDRLGLGPIRRDLLPTYQRWLNDLRVTRTLAAPCRPFTFDTELAWYERASRGVDPVFTIFELDGLRPVGNTGLHDLDAELGTAEFGMFIGEPELWNRGYATEVCRLMLGYAFDVLGLHNVMLQTYAPNPAAVRAYEKAGFRLVGHRRGAMRIGRERCDIVYMDATPDDVPRSPLHDVMHPAASATRPDSSIVR
jgi:RimJ/RimL family protein N-acetyltransferase